MKLICSFLLLFISTLFGHGQKITEPTLTKTQRTTIYDNVCCGLEDKSGNLWFGTTSEGIFCFDPITSRFTNYTVKDGLSDNNVSCMLEDNKGNLWFGTQNGVCYYDRKTFTPFPINGNELKFPVDSARSISNGILTHSPNWISSIFQDKTGNLWFGSCGYGVYRYDANLNDSVGQEKSMTIFTEKDGLCNNYVEGIIEDHSNSSRNGNIWFSTRGGGLCSYDASLNDSVGRGRSFKSLVADDIRHNHIFCIFQDKTGYIWIGTVNGGVRRYDPATELFTNFTWKDGVSTNTTCILEDKNGNLWLSSDGEGICRYDGKSFTKIEGICNNRVWSILEDKEGNLWFGARNIGLCRYNPITGVITDFSDNTPE